MGDRALWSHDINLDGQPVGVSQARAFVRLCLVERRLAYLSGLQTAGSASVIRQQIRDR